MTHDCFSKTLIAVALAEDNCFARIFGNFSFFLGDADAYWSVLLYCGRFGGTAS